MGGRITICRDSRFDEDGFDCNAVTTTRIDGSYECFGQDFCITRCFDRRTTIRTLDDTEGATGSIVDHAMDQRLCSLLPAAQSLVVDREISSEVGRGSRFTVVLEAVA